jgi:hypothetical protein
VTMRNGGAFPSNSLTSSPNCLARCYFKQGEWQVALDEIWYHVRASEICTGILVNLAAGQQQAQRCPPILLACQGL